MGTVPPCTFYVQGGTVPVCTPVCTPVCIYIAVIFQAVLAGS